MNPKIIIHYTSDIKLGLWNYPSLPTEKIHAAAVVIFTDGIHFRCVKNRWAFSAEDEKIPLSMLVPYLMQYEKYFTKEDLLIALAYETTT